MASAPEIAPPIGRCASCGGPIQAAECCWRERRLQTEDVPRLWHPMCLPDLSRGIVSWASRAA
ncbi:MAG TPA: hypothetical protein VHX66_17475 [Solirubrobacteraceae bacterium]|jgi:hypothetical protein|nr:hypothetical protein [Solirubrobacteraceae bacterium]